MDHEQGRREWGFGSTASCRCLCRSRQRRFACWLPDIRFTNLGEGPEGVTAADLTKKLLDEVTKSSITEMTKGLANLGKGTVDAANAAAKDAAQDPSKAVKSIGDLFKKK